MTYFLLLFFHFLAAASSHSLEAEAVLTVQVANIKSEEGKIYVAVYRPTDKFLEDETFKDVEMAVKMPVSEVSFSLPPGKYALAILHDLNGNQEMDSNFLGIPNEPFGISNNTAGGLSKPKFEESSFELSGKKTVQINLVYY